MPNSSKELLSDRWSSCSEVRIELQASNANGNSEIDE